MDNVVIYVLATIIIGVPAWKILRRAGFNPYIALLCFVPALGYVFILCVLAFAQWPVLKRRSQFQEGK